MNLALVVTHLKTSLSGVRQVGGAADLGAAAASKIIPPACFVIPHSEQVVDEDMEGDQVLRVVFSLVHVVANLRDAAGGAAQIDLDGLRTATHAALASLLLPGTQSAPRFSAGSLVQFADGQLMWADEFVVDVLDF